MSPFWRALVMLLMSVLAAGFLLAGMLTDYIGFNAVFIACGSVTMLVCVAALMHPKVQQARACSLLYKISQRQNRENSI